MTSEKNRPVYEKRLGSIRVAIWENFHDGKTWHNVALTRRYKDTNGEWKEASTFNGLTDLALVSEAIRCAREWITSREEQPSDSQAGNE